MARQTKKGVAMGGIALSGLLLAAALVGACATMQSEEKPAYLVPYATPADSPALIRHVVPDSPVKAVVGIGDLVLSVDGKPVASTWDFYSALTPATKVVRVRTKEGQEKDVPLSTLTKPNSYEMWAWLIEPGQTFSFKQHNPVYAEERDAALLYLKNWKSLVSASIWPTHPRYIEVYVELRVNPDCRDCKLENIAVLDLSRNSWLTPVSSEYVAWALYPVAGVAPGFMPVPPPTPIGYTATTTELGTLSARTYGAYAYGTYSGIGNTTVSPYYDYTMTNIALAYNLGAMLRHSQIQAQGAARVSFVTRRQSNFRIGDLNPGERITGYIHFQLPDGFEGPYLVGVKAGDLGVARFDSPKNR